MTITISGTNDGPTISATTDVASEITESDSGELSDSGSFQFADLDTTDIHSMTHAAAADNYVGSFTATLDQANKTVNWNFAVDNSAIQQLGDGEQLTQDYTVTVSDDKGATIDQLVTVTISGTNDGPTISATTDVAGEITESDSGELSDSGSFQFADLDTTDIHSITDTAAADNYVGSFTATLDQANKTVSWNFAVDNSAIQQLGDGEQLTQDYTVTVSDDKGATIDQLVTILPSAVQMMVLPLAPLPMWRSHNTSEITESDSGELSDSGSFQFADLDTTDTHSIELI